MAELSPPSPSATPKRKRSDLTSDQASSYTSGQMLPRLNKTMFTFEAPKVSDILNDGNSSPRSRVANRLRDLTLMEGGSGGGVAAVATPAPNSTDNSLNSTRTSHGGVSWQQLGALAPVERHKIFDFDGVGDTDHMQVDEDDESAMRKRVKLPGFNISPGAQGEASADVVPSAIANAEGEVTLQTAVDPVMLKTTKTGPLGKLQKSYPSINRLADSKSRRSRRAGTPPLNSRRKNLPADIEEEPIIVDPVRAALTWHEDEITVYDAEDKDDDGTGLNGIGFKPTPAVAYARAQKRRQQLSEYKKREEREARARRNQRRREQLGESSELKRLHSIVRVRFSESEPSRVVTM